MSRFFNDGCYSTESLINQEATGCTGSLQVSGPFLLSEDRRSKGTCLRASFSGNNCLEQIARYEQANQHSGLYDLETPLDRA